jgi:PAS domain S-box-containing protein
MSEEILQTVLQHAPLRIFAYGTDGLLTLATGGVEAGFGGRAMGSTGASIFSLWEDFPEILEHHRRALTGELVVALIHVDRQSCELRLLPQRGTDGEVTRVLGALIDITERLNAQREAEYGRAAAEELARLRAQSEREAHALAAASAALDSALEPAELYQRILAQVARILPRDYAGVRLYEHGWVVVTASLGTPLPEVGTRLFPLFDAEGRWLPVERNSVCYVPDTDCEPLWVHTPPRVGAYRVRSLIAVPLIIDGVTVGAFHVSSRTPNFYDDHDVQVAAAFGERVAVALRNARRYAAEQERAGGRRVGEPAQ